MSKSKKQIVTRKAKREALESTNMLHELYKIIKHFFPCLIASLAKVEDPRNESYIKYESQVILFMRILGATFHIDSMRRLTADFNTTASIKNICTMLNIPELPELPYWETINNYLKLLKPIVLEEIIHKLVSHLIRMRSFQNSRINNTHWQILIDGVHLYSFKERHCPHCLTKEHKDKAGNVLRTEYYHSVLEAKLVINGNIVISVASEFIDNDQPNTSTQDCELNAFYRLADKLKKRFKRLPICLTMDSLYACDPVFKLCQKNNWHYIIRFKEGSIPSVGQEFQALKDLETKQVITETCDNVTTKYRYVNNIDYKDNSVSMIEYEATDLKHSFVYVTDLAISKNNFRIMVEDGRRRWKIENEGFNTQKNGGYALTHQFSKDYTAMQNHYLLIQIGHMIAQFLENAPDVWSITKSTAYKIAEIVKQLFANCLLSTEFIMVVAKERIRYHFN